MDQTYPWKRFLLKRDSSEPLYEEGAYLPDPETSDSLWTSHIVSLDDLESVPCVVVLGEPGMGKSDALRNEKQRIDQSESDEVVRAKLVPLEEFSDGSDLRARIFNCDEWHGCAEGDGVFHLLLDSLDEVKLEVETACSIITEGLKGADVGRLRLRMCCRTADWPDYFESDLRNSWPDLDHEGLLVCRLLPLRRRDITQALGQEKLQADAFMAQVKDKALQPFAARPITLLALIDEFKKNGDLPKSKWEIYEKLCLRLCDDPNRRYKDRPKLKETTTVPAKRRLDVASAVAAVMMLCAKSGVQISDDEQGVADGLLATAELLTAEHAQSVFTREELDETLHSTLFRSTGANSFLFDHQTYMEFLAARYLRPLSFKKLKALLTVGQKILPQFREFAAWCADGSAPLKRWMIRHDPISMVHGDLSFLNEPERSLLVEGLLFQLDRLEHIDSVSLWDKAGKLRHPTVAGQVEPYIRDANKKWPVRKAACQIARECRLKELESTLVDVATNSTESQTVRTYACYALETIAGTDAKQSLRAYLLKDQQDLDERLKGRFLGLLWPGSLSIGEMLAVLEPAHAQGTSGGYGGFLYDLPKSLDVSHIPLTLNHFCGVESPHGVLDYFFERMLDRIFLRAVENLTLPGMRKAVARYALLKRTRGNGIVGGDEEPRLRSLFDENADLRREFAQGMLDSWPVEGVPSSILQLCLKEHTRLDDYFWLLDTVAGHPVQTKVPILEILSWYATDDTETGVKSDHVQRFHEAVLASPPEVQERFSWLKGMPLDCEAAERHRKWHSVPQEQSRKQAERERAKPRAEDIIAVELPKALRGEAEAWYRVCVAMSCESERIGRNSLANSHFLSESKRWRDAKETTREEVRKAALAFLLANPPTDHSWLRKGSKKGLIFAGQMALGVVGEVQSTLDQVPVDVLKAWVPTIIGLWGTADEGFRKVIKKAYSDHHAEFMSYLDIVLDGQNKGGDAREIAEELQVILDDRLSQCLLERMHRDDCSPATLGHLAKLLVPSHPDAAAEAVLYQFKVSVAGESETDEICVRAFQLILEHWSLKYWDQVEQWLCDTPEICYKAMCGLWTGYLHAEGDPLRSLEPRQVAELYTWLRNHRYAKLQESADNDMPSEAEDRPYLMIANYLMDRLVKLGTPEAVELLRKIKRDLKDEDAEFFACQINRAQEELTAKSWVRLTPQEVLRLHAAEKERLPIAKIAAFIVAIFAVLLLWLKTRGWFLWQYVGVGTVIFVAICLFYWLLSPDQKRFIRRKKSEFTGWQG